MIDQKPGRNKRNVIAALILTISVSILCAACSKKDALIYDDGTYYPSATHYSAIMTEKPNYSADNNTVNGMLDNEYYADGSGRVNDAGGSLKSSYASAVKKAAENRSDVRNAAVVETHDGDILVALDLKDNNKSYSNDTRSAIINAAGSGRKVRISTDAAHYTQVRAMEATANGATIAADKIREIWDAIT